MTPGTAAPCPDTAGRRRPAAAGDSERAPLRNPTAIRNRCWAWRQRTEQHTGRGNAYLAAIFSSAVGGAAKTGTFLGERHRRVARRRSSKRAIVASGRSILANAWHLLSNPDARFRDLGPGFYAAASTPNAANATTSASSKPTATPSPSSPPPDPTAHSTPAPLTFAGSCRLPTNSPMFGLEVGQSSTSSPALVGAKPQAPK